jgi:dihydrofolate reductase
MRSLIYSMSVSLDGFIAGPDGAIDWSVPDEELFGFHTQQIQETGVHLCGRRLYETMVYWETADACTWAGYGFCRYGHVPAA